MHNIMINRYVLEFLQVFRTPCCKRYIFLLFRLSLFRSFEKSAENENRNRKTAFFAVFARKRPFLSQIKR